MEDRSDAAGWITMPTFGRRFQIGDVFNQRDERTFNDKLLSHSWNEEKGFIILNKIYFFLLV